MNLPFEVLCPGFFAHRHVEIKWNPNKTALSNDLAKEIEAFWKTNIVGTAGLSKIYNGNLCSLRDWQSTDRQLILTLAPTDYKQLLFSNHIRVIAHITEPEFNPRALGISAVLVGCDNQIVLMQRSSQVGECPNMLDVFGGHVEPGEHDFAGVPDPFVGIATEIREEVGIAVPPESFACNGLIDTSLTSKPELIFSFTSDMSGSELIGKARETNSEEIAGFMTVENNRVALSSFFLKENDNLSPSAFGSLWLHLQML